MRGSRIAILAHEQFPDRAKTAVGLLRYAEGDVVAILDRTKADSRVSEHVRDAGGPEAAVQDAPIVASMNDVPTCDALVVGIAPIGGGFDESWRSDVSTAIERGCDVYAGLHYLLQEDGEFSSLAAGTDATLHDVREPPGDLTVADGTASEVSASVVLTVGTDCSTGKMTAAFELHEAARERGLDAGVVPTGQTGIMIAGGGIAVDRAISDYAAGAVERMVHERGEADVLFVEGQGAICHPAYASVTTAICHGAQPDAMVLCHDHGRDRIYGYEDYAIPAVEEVARLSERLVDPVRPAPVAAGALDTRGLSSGAASEAVETYSDRLGVPATDPIRFGSDDILDALSL